MSAAVLDLPAPRLRGRWRVNQLLLLLNFAAVALVLTLWWAATGLGWIAPVFLPSPGAVLHAAQMTLAHGDLLVDVMVSARRVFAGFALAALVAVPLGIVMGVWRPAKAIMDPFVSLLRPLPSITWIPLTILWLGIGETQKIAIVFLGSWIYILLYTFESTRRVDPLLAAGGDLVGGRVRRRGLHVAVRMAVGRALGRGHELVDLVAHQPLHRVHDAATVAESVVDVLALGIGGEPEFGGTSFRVGHRMDLRGLLLIGLADLEQQLHLLSVVQAGDQEIAILLELRGLVVGNLEAIHGLFPL